MRRILTMAVMLLYVAVGVSLTACAETVAPDWGPVGVWQLQTFVYGRSSQGIYEEVDMSDMASNCNGMTLTVREEKSMFTGTACIAFLRWPQTHQGPNGYPVGFFYGDINGPEFLVGTWKMLPTDPITVRFSFDYGDPNRDSFLESLAWSQDADSLYRIWGDTATAFGQLTLRRVQ